MLLGIISDSHGDCKSITKACDFLVKNKVDGIIHLGDNSYDVTYINHYPVKIYSVPGTRDPEYFVDNKRTQILNTANYSISMSHLVQDCNYDAKIVLYGHTHIPEYNFMQNKLFINPGHIENNKKRYPIPTFISLKIKQKNASLKLFNLNNELLDEKVFFL